MDAQHEKPWVSSRLLIWKAPHRPSHRRHTTKSRTSLLNAGLEDWVPTWGAIVRAGFCTKDIDVGAWVLTASGRDGDKKTMMSLTQAIKLFLPQTPAVEEHVLQKHTAGVDAQLHRLLYIGLCERLIA